MPSGRLSRIIRGPLTPRIFRRFAIAAVAALMFIVPSGGLVRLTGSGLGCPDWPGCHGSIVPPMQGHTIIEYSNRVASAVVVALSILLYLTARRVIGSTRTLRRASLTAALASIGQAPLGGLTVVFDLHPVLVACHFLLSFVALTGGVISLMIARDLVRGTQRRRDPRRATAAGIMLSLLAVVVISGVLVTASGPHPGDPNVKIRFWNLGDAAAVHVRVVIGFVIAGILFTVWLWRQGVEEPFLRRLIMLFAPLLALQIAVGEYQYRNQLPWEVILVHVTIIAILFAVAVGIMWMVARPRVAPATDRAQLPVSDAVTASPPPATVVSQAASTDRA